MLSVDEFQDVWPDVERRVVAGLRRRGIRAEVAEEAVQEAAARAWRTQPDVASADELARWTYTVARRVVIDGARRRHVAIVPLDAVAPGAEEMRQGGRALRALHGEGVEPAVLARLDLDRAARALASLRDADRSSVLTSIALHDEGGARPPGVERRAAVRDAVRLHRARARLAEAFRKAGGLVTTPWWRRWVAAVSIDAKVAKVALPVAAAAVIVLLFGSTFDDHSPARRPPARPPAAAAPLVPEAAPATGGDAPALARAGRLANMLGGPARESSRPTGSQVIQLPLPPDTPVSDGRTSTTLGPELRGLENFVPPTGNATVDCTVRRVGVGGVRDCALPS